MGGGGGGVHLSFSTRQKRRASTLNPRTFSSGTVDPHCSGQAALVLSFLSSFRGNQA